MGYYEVPSSAWSQVIDGQVDAMEMREREVSEREVEDIVMMDL